MAKGAIAALIIFVIGFVFALPDEANIGIIILDGMQPTMCNASIGSEVACNQLVFWKVALRVIGVLMIVGDIVYIVKQARAGNF